MRKVGGEVEDGFGEGKKWKVSVESGVVGMEKESGMWVWRRWGGGEGSER